MKKMIFAITIISLLLLACSCRAAYVQNEATGLGTDSELIVAVGILPEAAFVEAVAGGLADMVTLVPPGCSPANYQPTATQMQALSDAQVYFTLQMPTEQVNILPKASGFNESLKIVDLRAAVSQAYPLLNGEGQEVTSVENALVDPHVWLSPKRAVVMVQAIADTLSEIDEANEDVYQANAADYIADIEALDSEIRQTLSALDNKSFLIYHGAYGYFAHDYGLKMTAIEIEGKQATAEEMQRVIDYALNNDIKTVFYQEEFDDSQAATIAQEIGGAVHKVAPLSINYIQGLRDFTNALAQ